MATPPNRFSGQELKWDIPHILRGDSNLAAGFGATFKLTPTALLPANWVLFCSDGHSLPFVWHINLCSDTAIEWQIGKVGAGDPGFAVQSTWFQGQPGGPAAQSVFEAEVKAGVAMNPLWDGGFLAPGVPTQPLGKGWMVVQGGRGLYVKTAAVAANVYCTFYFTEFEQN